MAIFLQLILVFSANPTFFTKQPDSLPKLVRDNYKSKEAIFIRIKIFLFSLQDLKDQLGKAFHSI